MTFNQWPHENSDLDPDPNLVFGRVKNGLRYVLYKNNKPEKRLSLNLIVQAGSHNEMDNEQGFAHFVEHMAFHGSRNFPSSSLIKNFQNIGVKYGKDLNAHTRYFQTIYNIFLPVSDIFLLNKGFLFIKDIIDGLLFPESEIETERNLIISEINSRLNFDYKDYISRLKYFFPNLRLSHRMPLGKIQTINNATQKALEIFYNSWYRPENMIISIVGDFNINQIEQELINQFSNICSKHPYKSSPDYGYINQFDIKFYHNHNPYSNITKLTIENVWTSKNPANSLKGQYNYILNHFCASLINNRIYKFSNEKEFITAIMSFENLIYGLNFFKLEAKTYPDKWQHSFIFLKEILNYACKSGFTEDEIDHVKKTYQTSLKNSIDQTKTKHSCVIANKLINDLDKFLVSQSPEQEYQLYYPFIQSINTNIINNRLCKICSKNRHIIVTGNTKISDTNILKKIIKELYFRPTNVNILIKDRNNINESDITNQNQYFNSNKYSFIEPEIKNQSEISGILQINYSNNLRLNIKNTDFVKDQILVSLSFGNGKINESESGCAILAQSILNQEKIFSVEKDIDFSEYDNNPIFQIKQNCSLIKGITCQKEFSEFIRFIYLCITKRIYNHQMYKNALKEIKNSYNNLNKSLRGALIRYAKIFFAGEDTSFSMPDFEKIKKIPLEKIINWINLEFQKIAEISIVGDFDKNIAEDFVFKHFANLKIIKSVKEKIKKTNIFPEGKTKYINIETNENKELLTVAWPVYDLGEIYLNYKLSILNRIFSDSLREKLRKISKQGYFHNIKNHSSQMFQNYALFTVSIINIGNTETIENEIKQLAFDIADKGITEFDLKQAKEPLLIQIEDSIRTNAYWLNHVLTNSVFYPEQINGAISILEDYKKLNLDDITNFLKKIFNNRSASIIIKSI